MGKTYKYRTNEELWRMKDELKALGFKLTADCYWAQLMERGEEVVKLERDEYATAADPIEEEPAEGPADVEKLCHEYKELQRMQEELNAELEALKEKIKAAMNGAEALTAGCFKIGNRLVTSSRFDSAAFKKAMPELAAAFTKTTQTHRFSIV